MNVGTRTRDRDSKFLSECVSWAGHIGPVSETGLPESNVSRLLLTPSITGWCGCRQRFEKGVNVWMEVLWEAAKNWENFTQNTKARDSPFSTNSSLAVSHPKAALQLLLKMFQRVTKCSKSSLLFYGDRHKTNHGMMCCLLHFWLHIDRTDSAASTPAAHQPFGGACFTMATLFICSGALREAERSEVKRNWKSDPPPKTVKWHSNNPETLAWTCLRKRPGAALCGVYECVFAFY